MIIQATPMLRLKLSVSGLMWIKSVPTELSINEKSAGTKFTFGGLGVDYPKDVRQLFTPISAEGHVTYASNGDGDDDDLSCSESLATVCGWAQSEEFMTQFTQGILDHAETVTFQPGIQTWFARILAVLE